MVKVYGEDGTEIVIADDEPEQEQAADDAAEDDDETAPETGDESRQEDRDDGDSEDEDGEEYIVEVEGENDDEEGEDQGGDEGDEGEERAASPLIKKLRRENRRLQRKLKQAQTAPPPPQDDELPAEPTLEEFDYDNDKFKVAYAEWYVTKQKHDAQAQEEQARNERINHRYMERQRAYETNKASYGAADFEDAEAVVADKMPEFYRSAIVDVARDPVETMYALGKAPNTLARLSSEENPMLFAYELGWIDANTKVHRRKPETQPETRVRGAAPTGATASDRAAEKALRTGDATAVVAQMRAEDYGG